MVDNERLTSTAAQVLAAALVQRIGNDHALYQQAEDLLRAFLFDRANQPVQRRRLIRWPQDETGEGDL